MRPFLILVLLCLPPLLGADELSSKQAELKALQERIRAIATAVQRDQQERDAVRTELQRIEQRLGSLRGALRQLSGDLSRLDERAERLKAEQTALQQHLKQQYQALAAQLRSAFIIGRQARSRMLLSQQDPARLARLQVYLERFQRQHRREISGFEQTLEALTAKRREADLALQELQQTRLARQQTLAGIESQRGSRKQLLDRIDARLKAQGHSMQRLRQQQAALEALIEELSQAVIAHDFVPPSGPFADNRGQLVPPAEGRLLARFRQRKPDGESRWNGIWIAAEAGQPVRAVAAARVVYVGWMHQLGLLVVLDHGDGYFSLYGHNHAALSNVGDEVAAGEPIAEAGNTGGHREHGVYLEIRKGRKALNPSRWLAG